MFAASGFKVECISMCLKNITDRLLYIIVPIHPQWERLCSNLLLSLLQALPVRSGKPPVTQIHAEMAAYVQRALKDLFVIVQKNSGVSTATLQLTSTAWRIHVRGNKFARWGCTRGLHFPYLFYLNGI